MIFVLLFVNVVYHIINLLMFTYPCIPEINSTWSWCMILSMCCWIWFTNILLRFFSIYIHQGYWKYFSFPVVSLSGFHIRIMLVLHSPISNNNLAAQQGQKCLCGGFGIQIRDYESPGKPMTKACHFKKAGWHTDVDSLTKVLGADSEIASSSCGSAQPLLALVSTSAVPPRNPAGVTLTFAQVTVPPSCLPVNPEAICDSVPAPFSLQLCLSKDWVAEKTMPLRQAL